MEEKRKRNPNFSVQDSDFKDMDMSFHNVDKARFSNRRGPIGRTLYFLTEAVIDVIGKQSAAVVGAAGAANDSTLASLMLPQQFDLCDSEDRTSVSDGPIFNVMDLVPVTPSQRVQSCSTTTSTLPR
ncbi:hypothetical protein DPMN_042327 [Dreissena polymorpha]|uniref:Uncharacterized protein n=1 Tax=Dreissena polymorpha TaxID=45954 RepID=A0A9D4D0W1_DREPO|nr:hypothetical protein DPMN_042327 [Dreissena polymorpha]